MREPNTECFICKKSIYRRPSHLLITKHSYCSGKCEKEHKGEGKIYQCLLCNKDFKSNHKGRKYCSRICSNQGRTGVKYKIGNQLNRSQRNLAILKAEFNFKECMVEGCTYNKTYDIHRLVKGGQYIIGNMFAICPNHHAEVHRYICKFEKVNNYTLIAKYTEGHTA